MLQIGAKKHLKCGSIGSSGTMRRLSLMRHAEARERAGGADGTRPLTAEGIGAAQACGAQLHRDGMLPDLILCSDARRALETAAAIFEGAGTTASIIALPALYRADPEAVLRLVSENAYDEAAHVMVVGHNPTMVALAYGLASRSGKENPVTGFAPGTCARFTLDAASWKTLQPTRIRLEQLLRPASDAHP